MNASKYQKEYIKYLFKQDTIRFLFVIIGLISIGSAYVKREAPLLQSFYDVLSSPWCFCIMNVLTLLIVNLNMSHHLEGQENFSLRFLNRKKLLLEQFRIAFKINNIFFLFTILMVFIGVNIFSKGYIFIGIQKHGIVTYNIPNIVYLIFFLIRMFFLSQLLSMINVAISKLTSSKGIYMINILILASFLNTDFIAGEVIDSIFQMKFLPTEYMMVLAYKNFFFEVFCSFLYLGILLFILLAICLLVLKKGYDIGK